MYISETLHEQLVERNYSLVSYLSYKLQSTTFAFNGIQWKQF